MNNHEYFFEREKINIEYDWSMKFSIFSFDWFLSLFFINKIERTVKVAMQNKPEEKCAPISLSDDEFDGIFLKRWLLLCRFCGFEWLLFCLDDTPHTCKNMEDEEKLQKLADAYKTILEVFRFVVFG